MKLLAKHAVTAEKCISLYLGDLTQMPTHERVDLLLVSAFPSDYTPTPSSLIGALEGIDISLRDLALHKEADLRPSLSTWLSADISRLHPEVGFRHILCFESTGDKSPPEAVGDIFRAILPFALGDPPIRSMAMPVLASGDQAYDPVIMLAAIFDAGTHWLAAGLPLDNIRIVVHKEMLATRLQSAFVALSERHRANGNSTPPSADIACHFFLSYAHADSAEADYLLDRLLSKRPSLRIFRDTLNLNVGQSWQSALDEALQACRRVIAVYSPAYISSKMCLEEFNMARVRHRQSSAPVLTPIYLRHVGELPLYMRTVQFIDCREANPRLLAAAAEQLGSAT